MFVIANNYKTLRALIAEGGELLLAVALWGLGPDSFVPSKHGQRLKVICSPENKLSLRKHFIVIAIGLSLLLSQSKPSCAKEGEWNIQLEPMYIAVRGNNTSIADKVTYSPAIVDGWWTQLQTRSPLVDLKMDNDLTLRGELEYKKYQWGIGISGWGLNTGEETILGPLKSGSLFPAPGQIIPPTFIKVVVWGGEVLTPPALEMQGGLTLAAKNDLEVWSTDVYGIRTLVQLTESQFNVTFGAKIGSFDNERNENVNGAYFMRLLTPPGAPAVIAYISGSARQDSQTHYSLMAGPSLGFRGQARYEKHWLGMFFNQAILLGEMKQNATFKTLLLSSPDEPSIATRTSETFFKQEFGAVPITEMRLKYLYAVTDSLSLGLGLFASMWWNVQLAPEFSRASIDSFAPDTWPQREQNLQFLGVTTSLNYRF